MNHDPKVSKKRSKKHETRDAKVLKTFLRKLNTFSTVFTFFVLFTCKKHVFST